MKIVLAPNPILSLEAKSVIKIDSQIQKLIEDMKITLSLASDPEGVGLAAPQIGEPYKIFIVKPTPKSKIMVFINPEVLEINSATEKFTKTKKIKNKKQVQKLEGCLSLKNIWGTVKRSPKLTLKYLDEAGQTHTKEFKDFLATIIQHEYDHLNGILFPRRVLEQKGKLYKSERDEKGEDIFEEIEL